MDGWSVGWGCGWGRAYGWGLKCCYDPFHFLVRINKIITFIYLPYTFTLLSLYSRSFRRYADILD